MKSTPRVLFIVKHRTEYGTPQDLDANYNGTCLSSGLFNSARFVSDMLNAHNVTAKVVHVVDNNDIDREVTRFKPTVSICEALWVVPSKFAVLAKLHPKVQWVTRIHSELPFLAQEGIAMEWLTEYPAYPNCFVSANSPDSFRDLQTVVKHAGHDVGRCLYLPNYYRSNTTHTRKKSDGFLDVACFGATRLLKNQLVQAVAAIDYANSIHKTLRFHINATRGDSTGGALKNLRSLFAVGKHKLVEYPWMQHSDFVALLHKMDVGLQVSLSETFNIVAADMVSAGLPVVVSPEITWTSKSVQAEATVSADISQKLGIALDPKRKVSDANAAGLRLYCWNAKRQWLNWLNAE